MAKTLSEKTVSKSRVATGKARVKESTEGKGFLSRVTPRVSLSRSPSGPRGAVSTKPVGRIRTFLREVRVEITKVTWPSRKELLQATAVVIIAVAIAGVYIGVLDFIWNLIVRAVGLG